MVKEVGLHQIVQRESVSRLHLFIKIDLQYASLGAMAVFSIGMHMSSILRQVTTRLSHKDILRSHPSISEVKNLCLEQEIGLKD